MNILVALLAGTALAFGVDYLMFGVFFADQMSEVEKFFGSVMYPPDQRPSEMWFVVYELMRMGIIGMIIFQKPLTGMAAFAWGAAAAVLITGCIDFWWLMMFNDPNSNLGTVAMECVMGGIICGLCAWLMSWVYTKMS